MRTLLLAFLICASVSAPPAQAEPLQALDRLSVAGGLFWRELSLEGDVSAEQELEGEVLQFADDFDVEHRRKVDVFELRAMPWHRHEFGIEYHRDARTRTIRLDEQLEFDGEVFPINVDLRARTRFASLAVDYTAWVHAAPRSAIGLQVGLLRLSGALQLRGRAQSGDIGEAEFDASASDHLYAPLVGVAGRFVFGERLRGFAELQAIELSLDGLDGRAIVGTAGVEVYMTERLGLVVQYSDTRIRASESDDHFAGVAELGIRGPQALLKWRY